MKPTYLQYYLGVIISIFLFTYSFSQEQVIPIEFIGVEKGLPRGQIFEVLQDSLGFLWLGTMDGVIKYDGDSYTLITYEPGSRHSLSSSTVLGLTEDKEGRIWIGTNKGLNIYDRKKDTILQIFTDSTSLQSIPNNHIQSLFADKEGNIWIGTANGFAVWIAKEQKFYRLQNKLGSVPISHALCFIQAQNGQIWLGAKEGLGKVDMVNYQYETFPIPLGSIILKEFIAVHGIQEDPSGILWLASHNGLRLYDPKSQEYQLFPLPKALRMRSIHDLYYDSQGNLWLSFNAKGLVLLPRADDVKHSDENPSIELLMRSYPEGGLKDLTQDRQSRFFAGKEGHLWYGRFNGLGKIDLGPERFPHYAPATNSTGLQNLMRTVYQDSLGGIWMQNYDTDVYYSEKLGQKPISIPNQHPQGHRVIFDCFFMDRDSLLWIGTGSIGLLLYDLKLKKFLPPPLKDFMHVYHIEADIQDSDWLWVSADKGLARIHRMTFETKWYYPQHSIPGLRTNQALKFCQETNGRIWLHLENYSTGKLGFFEPAKESFQVLDLSSHLPTALNELKIRGMALLGDSTLWFGGEFGLGKLNIETLDVSIYTQQNGLAENTLFGLVVDKQDKIWIKHLKYISRLDPGSGEFAHYSISPSMKEMNTLGGHVGRDGKVYFNGNEGFYAFDPQKVKNDPFQANLVLTGIEVNNKPVEIGLAPEFLESIQLENNERALTFHFVSLNYDANRNQYRYRLVGFDKDWIEWNPDGKAVYTNLDPGSYVFEAQARNGDQVEGGRILRIRVKVAYPWYQKAWALLLFVLSGMALVVLMYRFLLSRQLAKQETEKLRHLNLSQSRFFAHISHELRTPLTLIQGMARKVEEHPNRFLKEGIHLIQRQTQALSDLVDQMLDLGKSEQGALTVNRTQGDVIPIIKQVSSPFIYLAKQHEISFEIDISPDYLNMDFDPDKLGKIISNLLGNAFKFTPTGGKVSLKVYQNSSSLFHLEVKDSGIGIAPEDLERIFDPYYQVDDIRLQRQGGVGIGLSLVKEYIQLLKGTIEVKSTVNEGTTFLVILPIRNHFKTPTEKWKIEIDQDLTRPESISELPAYFNPSEVEILLVEDHVEIRKYLNLLLSPTYKIRFASNGQEGLAKAKKYIPDLMICDIMMPQMDGLELLEALRKDPITSHIPVLLLTARGDKETRLMGFGLGAEALLTKPFSEQELAVRIQGLLHRQKALQHYYHQPGLIPNVRLQDKLEREFLTNLNSILDNHLDETDYSVDKLSKEIGMSRPQLYRKVKAITDRSIELYIRSYKIFKARQLLQSTDLRIDEIADLLGFSSPSNFSKVFKIEVGANPRNFRRQFALK